MSDDSIHIPRVLPVFPLPGVVLFPRAILPLHVFEPRYREMAADALAGEEIICVALLKSGFEPLYYTRRAPIHSVVGVGLIAASEQLEDGNYNILLQGIARAHLVKEFSGAQAYRSARVELLPTVCAATEDQTAQLRHNLRKEIALNTIVDQEQRQRLLQLCDSSLELGELSDLVASSLPLMPELRQGLLAEAEAAARADLLIGHVRTLSAVLRCKRMMERDQDWNMN